MEGAMKILVHSSMPVFQRVRKLLCGNGKREVVFVGSMEELKQGHSSYLVFIEAKRYTPDTLCRCMTELEAVHPVLLTDRGTDWNRLANSGVAGFVSMESGDSVFAARMEAAMRRLGMSRT
jgi:hypothetical protein